MSDPVEMAVLRRMWRGWKPSEVVDGEGVWTMEKPWPQDDVEEWMTPEEAALVAALDEEGE